MITWNAKNVKRAKSALRLLNDYIHTNGLRQSPPILSESLTEELKEELGKSLRKFLHLSKNRITFRTLTLASKSMVCFHCKECFVEGHCKSLCDSCKLKLPKSEKVKYRVQGYENTCMSLHNRRNIFAGKEGNALARQGMLKKRGVSNAMELEESRRKISEKSIRTGKARALKGRQTMQRKSGVDHWTQLPYKIKEMQDRLEATHGIGIRNVMHVPKFKKAHKSRMEELAETGFWKYIYDYKVVPSTKQNFGVDNVFRLVDYINQCRFDATGFLYPLQNPASENKRKETCKERYGGTHHMHDPAIFAKTMANHRRIHLYEVKYKRAIYRVIGSYEVFILKSLLNQYDTDDISTGFELQAFKLSASNRYYPDFYVESTDTYYEVKSTYTLIGSKKHGWSHLKLNRIKAKECLELGVKVRWVVPSPYKR